MQSDDERDSRTPQEETREAIRRLFETPADAGTTRHAYHVLPKQEGTRLGRVSAIHDIAGKPLEPSARLIGVAGAGRVEKGQFVVVPADFPAECPIRVGERAYYAFARVGDEYHRFIVWPQPSAENAREEYEHQRAFLDGYPEEIGRVYRPRRAEAEGEHPLGGMRGRESDIPREWRNKIPRGLAKCSCGLQTHIMFVEPDDDPENGRYEADSPRWQFRSAPEPGLACGWYCGKEGHQQAEYIELDTSLMFGLSGPRHEAQAE